MAAPRTQKLKDLIRQAGLMCGAKARSNNNQPCKNPPYSLTSGNGRCRYHGGMCTGAKTPQGIINARLGSIKGGLRSQVVQKAIRAAKAALEPI